MPNNSKEIILDTSFLSTLFRKNDVLHEQAVKLYAEKILGNVVLIPVTVLLELTLLAPKYVNYNELQKFLNYLKFKTYYLDSFFEVALKSYQTGKHTVSLKAIDLSILISALDSGADLITFDKKLNQVWLQTLESVQPDRS